MKSTHKSFKHLFHIFTTLVKCCSFDICISKLAEEEKNKWWKINVYLLCNAQRQHTIHKQYGNFLFRKQERILNFNRNNNNNNIKREIKKKNDSSTYYITNINIKRMMFNTIYYDANANFEIWSETFKHCFSFSSINSISIWKSRDITVDFICFYFSTQY